MQQVDQFEQAEARFRAQELQFLQSRSPDDWHRYAFTHNWDDGLNGLFWIVSQPSCDKATAMLIFWRGEPTAYDYETDGAKMGDDPYAVAPMLRYIAERFNTSGYPRAEIAYDFLQAAGHEPDSEFAEAIEDGRLGDIDLLLERQQSMTNARVKLHPDLQRLTLPGREVASYDNADDFHDQLPVDPDDVADDIREPRPTEPLDYRSISADDASARIRAIRRQVDSSSDDDADAKKSSGVPSWLKGLFRR